MMRNPAPRIAVGLVSLMLCAFLLFDLVFRLIPDEREHQQAMRQLVTELGAVQVARWVGERDLEGLRTGLAEWQKRYPELTGIAVRERDGTLLVTSGSTTAPAAQAEQHRLNQIRIPLRTPDSDWGQIEFSFRPAGPATWIGWLLQTRVWAPVLLVLTILTGMALYLRRAFMYLDPSRVVPDRVRKAFDSLVVGVALLDRQGRVMLANRALRQWPGTDPSRWHGRPLEQALALNLQSDTEAPWITAMNQGRPVQDQRITVGPEGRVGSLGCSPIYEGPGRVRGCLVTLSDLSEIERSNDELRQALAELERSQATIESQNRELARLALRDGLTGLLNRRAFFQATESALARCRRSGTPIAVAMLDIDHFKSFNDRYGHATGDLVLQRVALCLQQNLRESDLCGRYGGEEFCIFIEQADTQQAAELAERLRAAIEHNAGLSLVEGEDLSVTASIGLYAPGDNTVPIDGMLKQADAALYRAKRSGRNRVVQASEQEEEIET